MPVRAASVGCALSCSCRQQQQMMRCERTRHATTVCRPLSRWRFPLGQTGALPATCSCGGHHVVEAHGTLPPPPAAPAAAPPGARAQRAAWWRRWEAPRDVSRPEGKVSCWVCRDP
eukprot:7045643-Prymnesium_polylepis.1